MAYSAHHDKELVKEIYDTDEELEKKINELYCLVIASERVVFFTGAGISTSAGIPDFRGPEGKWTRLAEGKKPKRGTSSLCAIPTATHMSLVRLQQEKICTYLISQNCDGLHRRSGIKPSLISELHGNGNIEFCENCGEEYLRDFHCTRLKRGRDHYTGRHCPAVLPSTNKICNGRLMNSTIDFGQDLPQEPFQRAYKNSKTADLHIVLGSSLTVSPACDMPVKTYKNGGKVVIVNLQKTPLDRIADVRIYQKCDEVMIGLMNRLKLSVPKFKLHRYFDIHFTMQKSTPLHEQWKCSIFPFEFGTSDGKKIPATIFRTVSLEVPHTPCSDDKLSFTFPLEKNKDRLVPIQFEFMGNYSELPWRETFSIPQRENIDESSFSQIFVNHSFHLSYDPMERVWSVQDHKNTKSGNLVSNSACVKDIMFPPSADRKWSTAVCFPDNRVVIAGGITTPRSATTNICIFDASPGKFRTISSDEEDVPFVHKPRWGHTAAQINSFQMILVGGWDSKSQFSDMWRFDMHTEQIAQVVTSAEGPSCRAGHSVSFLQKRNQLLLFGGSCCVGGPYEFYCDGWLFDLSTYEWQPIKWQGEVPSSRAQHSAVLLNEDTLVVFGGYDGANVFADLYLLDLVSMRWSKVKTNGNGPCGESELESSNFRVYPARGNLLNVSSGDERTLLYSGKDGVYSLNCDTWLWSKSSLFSNSIHAACVTKQGVLMCGGTASRSVFLTNNL